MQHYQSARGSLALPAAFALLRPNQWLKNIFILAPIFFTPPAMSARNLAVVLCGVVAFCCFASAIYIVNDYCDREADRRHADKANRPLAAGTVSVPLAAAMFTGLLVAGFTIALWLSPRFAALGAIYVALNLAYSFWLKHIAILDVMAVALSFVLRVMAGALLIGIKPSAWILIVSGLLALFIALAKRRDDLVRSLDGRHRRSLNGYTEPFLDTAVMVALVALLVAYMVYTTDRQVMLDLGTERLVYTITFVIAGILRYLQIMLVEKRSGAPTTLVFTDRFLIATILLWVASLAILIHA